MKHQSEALAAIPVRTLSNKTFVYLHSSKETMYDKGEALGLSEKALEKFIYTCSEVKIGLEVNLETGEATIISCDNRRLGDKP
jgi:hypothetical protein